MNVSKNMNKKETFLKYLTLTFLHLKNTKDKIKIKATKDEIINII